MQSGRSNGLRRICSARFPTDCRCPARGFRTSSRFCLLPSRHPTERCIYPGSMPAPPWVGPTVTSSHLPTELRRSWCAMVSPVWFGTPSTFPWSPKRFEPGPIGSRWNSSCTPIVPVGCHPRLFREDPAPLSWTVSFARMFESGCVRTYALGLDFTESRLGLERLGAASTCAPQGLLPRPMESLQKRRKIRLTAKNAGIKVTFLFVSSGPSC